MAVELEYAQLIILLYTLAKWKINTSHEEAKVRKCVVHFLGEKKNYWISPVVEQRHILKFLDAFSCRIVKREKTPKGRDISFAY